jgi:hypothetical protein
MLGIATIIPSNLHNICRFFAGVFSGAYPVYLYWLFVRY